MVGFFPRFIASGALLCVGATATQRDSDILIYGCTSGAITAAVQAKHMGKSVVMVCPEKHLGGLTAGGLGWTDSGNKAVIGGLSREFYHRVWQQYDKPEAWRWQKREQYGNKGQGTEALDSANRTMWIFEPHVAEHVYEDLGQGSKDPDRPQRLARPRERREEGGRPDRLHHDAGRKNLLRENVHRCDLRRRPDGRRGRRLPCRPRIHATPTTRNGTVCRPECFTTVITSAC